MADSKKLTAPAPSRSCILDRPIIKPKTEVSLSAFALLFLEIVQYQQNRIETAVDLAKKLEEIGYRIGQRMVELVGCRDRVTRRETRLVNMLQHVTTVIWKQLFGKAADSLERSTENENEYMIGEVAPLTNTFVSVPQEIEGFNCASFIAGIIAGVLDSAKFNAEVTAHHQGEGPDRTVFLIKFSPERIVVLTKVFRHATNPRLWQEKRG